MKQDIVVIAINYYLIIKKVDYNNAFILSSKLSISTSICSIRPESVEIL
jgi:hypothetical protein